MSNKVLDLLDSLRIASEEAEVQFREAMRLASGEYRIAALDAVRRDAGAKWEGARLVHAAYCDLLGGVVS